MASFCWIRPLQVGHGIRRSYRSRAPLSTPCLSTYLKSRHLQKPRLFCRTHCNSTSQPPLPRFISSSTPHCNSTSQPPLPRFISSSTPSSDTLTDINSAPQTTLAERCPFKLNYIEDIPYNILLDLRSANHDKWGWVIYRCTYGDDEAWAKFQRIINERSRKDMAELKFSRKLASDLEWTFVSDQSLFDGASKDQLRQHFHAWATEARKSEQPRDIDSNNYDVSRYQYFIYVDEEVLRATVDADPDNYADCGWVNFVRCWYIDLDPKWREEAREAIDREDGDEGWMQISGDMVGPGFYGSLGSNWDYWYVYYRSPPTLANY